MSSQRRCLPHTAQAAKLLAGMFSAPGAAGELLFTPGVLWAAVTKDAAATGETPTVYLARVRAKALALLQAPEEDGVPRAVDHKAAFAALRRLGIADSNGLMALLTGPHSVGKTLLLRKVAAEINRDKTHPRRVILFDARQYNTDLVRGIISQLAADTAFLKTVLESVHPDAAQDLIRAAEAAAPGCRARLAKAGMPTPVDAHTRDHVGAAEVHLESLLSAFFEGCKTAGAAPVLVIDEADHALSATTPERKQHTLNLLQLLTRVTKQNRQATVVLATSEPGLPFRLRDMGYDKRHIGKTIVAGEVPPAIMMDLQTRTWGCGEHLATALLMMYGGHVLHASAAVRELGIATEVAEELAETTSNEDGAALHPSMLPGTAAVCTILSNPAACLSDRVFDAAGVAKGDRERMTGSVLTAMRALVVAGFLPLDSEEDEVAKVLCLANVGFVVPSGATAASVPAEAWAARTSSGSSPVAVMMPSSHAMRLLVAHKAFPSEKAGTPLA